MQTETKQRLKRILAREILWFTALASIYLLSCSFCITISYYMEQSTRTLKNRQAEINDKQRQASLEKDKIDLSAYEITPEETKIEEKLESYRESIFHQRRVKQLLIEILFILAVLNYPIRYGVLACKWAWANKG